ncbi:MAG: endonuclease/exonuclease/phosphatase family protein [Candidatus Paceibacterota bacterium]|jgi:endonuclease/exonuclease/phosphatase family metal-dependent hydrolase
MENITSPIRLASVNIEKNKHLNTVLAFLRERKPNVICLQEVLERDMPLFEKELGMKGFFAITHRFRLMSDGRAEIVPMGVGILSNLHVTRVFPKYYSGDYLHLQIYDESVADTEARVLLAATMDISGVLYTIGTTHFTWSPKGEADDRQRRDLKSFFEKMDECKDGGIVVAGDFNAPRGREIFREISLRFKDNIPPNYITSLDPRLNHASFEIQHLMIDGVFSTPEYLVSNVSLNFGVSNHAAILADIKRV